MIGCHHARLKARDLADLEQFGDEMMGCLHVDAGRQQGHADGFGTSDEFVELSGMHACRRVDHQHLSVARRIANALLEGRDPADCREIRRLLRQPVEARTLSIRVGNANLPTFTGKEHCDAVGERTLAAAAFRIQYHHVAHAIDRYD